jgi:hypothetical protein
MWQLYEEGTSIGSLGSESGIITVDEQHGEGARITIEKHSQVAPFAITCGIYGSFSHTTFTSTEQEAQSKLTDMKADIDLILTTEVSDAMYYEWIEYFVSQF